MLILKYFYLIFLFALVENHLSETRFTEPEEYEYVDQNEDYVEDNTATRSPKFQQPRNVPFETYFVGTNLLDDGTRQEKCFSPEDESLLEARMEYETLLPQFNNSFDLATDQSVDSMLQYFYGINEIIDKFDDGKEVNLISRQAFSDLIGGYLNYFYIPLVKLSFYSGTLEYANTIEVLKLQTKYKRILNTNGNGWRNPQMEWFKPNRFHVYPLNLTNDSDTFDAAHPPCVNLILSEDDGDADSISPMLVSLPRLEVADARHLGNVWIPFKRKHNFNLAAKNSAFILLRYYVAVQKCYAFKSVSPKKFHRRLADWLGDRILPYLDDDVFYPGLGAVLRIVETIQSQSRRMVISPEYLKHEPEREPVKSRELIEIEEQVDKILEERKNQGFLETFSESLQYKYHKDRYLILVATLAICLICLFILLSACFWRKTRRRLVYSPEYTPEYSSEYPPAITKENPKSKRGWCPKLYRTKKSEPATNDVIDCEPYSPSVMSREKNKSETVTNLNEYRGSRLSNTSINSNRNDMRNKQRNGKKVKSYSFPTSQSRRVVNLSSQSSLFRPIGINPQTVPGVASFGYLSDDRNEHDQRSLLSNTSKEKAKTSPRVESIQPTRIPILQHQQPQQTNSERIATPKKLSFHENTKPKTFLDNDKPVHRGKFVRKPYRPITWCTKSVLNDSRSSWETLTPSEKI